VPSVSGFGEDGFGRLYATSLGGEVYRLGESGGALTKTSIGTFDEPVAVAAAAGDAERLFIAEKPGRVMLRTPSGTTQFLDITALVGESGYEEGLLSVAVSPDYATSGRLFVFYTDNAGDLQVDEYRHGARTPLLTIQHDLATNHNGGQLLFGPDNALYLSTGDGGVQGDPEGDAQNPGSLLGKILRIDVGIPPTGSTARDLAAPAVSARAPRRQRVLRLRGAILYARCSEACALNVGGTLWIGRRSLLLRRVTAELAANRRARLRVRLRPRAERLLRRALLRGGRPRVRLRLRAGDAAGNYAPLVRKSVRVRR
jgi:hypothetical protein